MATEAENHIMDRIKDALDSSQNIQVEEFLDLLLGTDKIFIYGVGRSGSVARAFSIRLVQLGLKVYFIGETTTPIVEPDDLVIIVSNTGETMSAIQTANIVRRVGAKVVAITAKNHSKLAHAASMIIHLNIKKEEKDSEFAPLGTIFEATALIFLDGVVAQLIRKMGTSEAQMRARHSIWV